MSSSVRSLSVIAVAGFLAACTPEALGFREQATSSVIAATDPSVAENGGRLIYLAVDRLVAGAPSVSPSTPLLVATFTNAQRIENGSPFGNIVADMVRSRLVQRGMSVSEMRLRQSVRMTHDNGELLLSRDRRHLVQPRPYGAVVTGTYAVGTTNVLVSLKLVSATDGRIISAVDFGLPRHADVDAMLAPSQPQARRAQRVRHPALAD